MIWLHVSELSIDRLLAGELRDADADAMRDHARACKACGDRLADAEATQREFVQLAPQLTPLLPVARPRPRYVAIIAGVAVAMAAACALVLAWPKHPQSEHAHVIVAERTKGRAIAGFFVAHDGDVRRGGVHETVMPGDRLQLFTTSSAPSWFAVISIDAVGKRSVYVEPRVIEPGTERLLPLSLELDDALGSETVVTIFCAERFDPLTFDLDHCTTDRFTLDKVSR